MSTNQEYNIIVQQLERLSSKIDDISKEVQLTNIEIAKLSGMKHALSDFKTWKENVESAVNAEDLRLMKATLLEVKKHSEYIDDVERVIEDFKKEKEIDKKEIDSLKTFKTQVVTYGTIGAFLFTTALTVLGWYLS